MGLEEILSKIEADTRKEVETILSEANKEAKKITEEADTKKGAILEDYKRRAAEEAEMDRKQKLSSVTLESRIKFEKALEEVEKKYFQKLAEKIKEFAGTDAYWSFLSKKIEDAVKKLGPGSLAYVRENDVAPMKGRKLPLEIRADSIDPIGGVVVTSADGKLIYDRTFSQILRDKNEELARIVRSYIR